ncbi:MAG: alpha/beta hydrolase [Gammaproteobacteria bacterium]|nr:alpha/beta hydrolase [Gammaproteobacteria bacterium]
MFLTTPSGVKLFYEQTGQGEDLILIAGLASDHTLWESMMPFLSQHFRVLRFDNRACGQSDFPKTVSIAEMASDVIALMDHLKIKSAYMAGHSMGSAILLQLSIQSPARIRKAMLCAAFAKLPMLAKIRSRISLDLMQANIPVSLIAETVVPWIFGSTFIRHEKNVGAIANAMISTPWLQSTAGYETQANALKVFDVRDRLNQITVKTLVVAGGKDILAPPACSRYIHRAIPNSEYVVIKKSGHMLPVEDPKELNRLMIDFCAQQ